LPELVEEALAEPGVEDGAKVIFKDFVSLLLWAFQFGDDFSQVIFVFRYFDAVQSSFQPNLEVAGFRFGSAIYVFSARGKPPAKEFLLRLKFFLILEAALLPSQFLSFLQKLLTF
jgi:hypothetical protein